jgi:hypothetical protein
MDLTYTALYFIFFKKKGYLLDAKVELLYRPTGVRNDLISDSL